MVEEKTFKRWIREYIDDVDINNIEYVTFTEEELESFILENYMDTMNYRLVSRQNDPYRPIGLVYLSFNEIKTNNPYEKEKRYLIGICKNKKGKKTIISVLKYFDNYIYSQSFTTPLTFFASVEVNEYFRNHGLCRNIINIFSKQVNKENPILITEESILGSIYGTTRMLRDSIQKNGLNIPVKTISEFTKEYYEKQLKRFLK